MAIFEGAKMPKTALNILGGMNAVAFRGAVAQGDIKSLSQISGGIPN